MSDLKWRFTAKMHGQSDVCRLLRRYPEKVGRSLLSLVKQEGRGLGVELARNTRPFGFSEKAKKRGEKAVASDIAKVFAVPSEAYKDLLRTDKKLADRYWAAIQNRRFAQARGILQKSGSAWASIAVGRLDPALHHASRDVTGRVTRHSPAMIVTGDKARDRYIAKKQRNVGYAKGAWLNAAKALGGRVRGAVQWATRHKTAPGTATVNTSNPSVTLVNNLDYAEAATTREGVMLALQVAHARLRKALATSLRKINERANRDLNRKAS